MKPNKFKFSQGVLLSFVVYLMCGLLVTLGLGEIYISYAEFVLQSSNVVATEVKDVNFRSNQTERSIGVTVDMEKSNSLEATHMDTKTTTKNQGTIATMASPNNGICEPPETSATTPIDCQVICGNMVCEAGENSTNCRADCSGISICGDGSCGAGETCASCRADCMPCCGDGICNGAETCSLCSADCGSCRTPPQECFLAGTLITMADGSKKPIEEIKIGDIVLAFDDETNQFKPDKVSKTFEHASQGYLIINGHLKVTANHPVLSNGQWVEVGSLKTGDQLLNEKGALEAISTIEKRGEEITTYDIEVNPYHSFIAEGYVVHNKGGFKG